ncbi:MAG: hypothetical protein U0744_12680 [Gemmataceae bacterium]
MQGLRPQIDEFGPQMAERDAGMSEMEEFDAIDQEFRDAGREGETCDGFLAQRQPLAA